MLPAHTCPKCGKWKARRAKQCMDCFTGRFQVEAVGVEPQRDDLVRQVFEWIISQSRGEVS